MPAPVPSKDEVIKVSFIGLKFECKNPTSKAIIILVLLLTFFMVFLRLLPKIVLLRLLMTSDVLMNYLSS